MKNTVLILAFFMCFLGCESLPIKSGRIPVTSEIVDKVLYNKKNLGDLKYYLVQTKSITMEIDKQKDVAEVSIRKDWANDNVLVINPPDSFKKPIQFSVNTEGKLIDKTKSGDLIIFFQENNATLRFKENQLGYYEPYSIIIPDNNNEYDYRIVRGAEIPRLYVYGQDNRKIQVKKTPVNEHFYPSNNPVASINGQNNNKHSGASNLPSPVSTINTQQPGNYVAVNGNNNNIYQNAIGNFDEYSPGRSPDTNIEGFIPINKNGVINYIKRKNGSLRWDIEPLITRYINEAREEGINPYLAIAQMLHRTNFLRNEQLERNYNYAGLANVPGRWNGKFHDMTQGVRAHIQHLKGYASRMRPKLPIDDPRYHILEQNGYIGTAKTLEQLHGKWMPAANSRNYINSVREIIEDLYRFQ
jgi:hypothetical protein